MYRFPRTSTKQEPKFIRPEILLHPNVPKPLHHVNPRSILGKEWWDIQRQKAYKKNNYCCWACGIHKSEAKYHQWLEAHEHYDINYETGCVKLKEIVALCHSCHNSIHDGRMAMLLRRGEITNEKYINILNHKIDLFIKYEIYEKSEEITKSAKWKDWHLFLNGEKYYTPYEDINDWEKKMMEFYG